MHEATHELLHLDGKIVKTVKLLVTRPGQLTREFIDGRRARYISPIRVYLTFSVLFFFLAAVTPVGDSFVRIKPGDSLEHARKAEDARKALMHNLPRAAFLLMPGFALLTWLFYRREQPYYIPHLYYSIHFHAFAFLILTIASLAGLAGTAGRGAGAALFLVLFPYHYIGLRRVFGGSRALTFVKGTVVGVLYWLVLAATMLGITWLTLTML